MDVSLASLDDLMNELQTRFDDFVCEGRKLVNAEHDEFAYHGSHKGSWESTIFLLHKMEYDLMKRYDESARDPEPWEDF